MQIYSAITCIIIIKVSRSGPLVSYGDSTCGIQQQLSSIDNSL